MSGPDNCQNCGTSFIGEPIPFYPHLDDCEQQKDRWESMGFERRCLCLPYGDAKNFRREIGHEVGAVYDGTLYWSCPDCGYAWPRFTDGLGRLTIISAEYVVAHNTRKAAS